MKYQVVYLSNTGNTELIAKRIFAALPGMDKDIVRFEPEAVIHDADIYYIGFWVNRGTCNMQLLEYLSSLHGKKIALFGTCGMGTSEEYYKRITDEIEAWVADDSECIGTFLCQGKMPMSVRNKYEGMLGQGNDEQIQKMIRNFDRALVHPDKADLEAADRFVAKQEQK